MDTVPPFDHSEMNRDLYDLSDNVQFERFCSVAHRYFDRLHFNPPRTPAEEQALRTLKEFLDDDVLFPRAQALGTLFSHKLRLLRRWEVFEVGCDTAEGWLLRKLYHRLPADRECPHMTYLEHLNLVVHRTEIQLRCLNDDVPYRPDILEKYISLKAELLALVIEDDADDEGEDDDQDEDEHWGEEGQREESDDEDDQNTESDHEAAEMETWAEEGESESESESEEDLASDWATF